MDVICQQLTTLANQDMAAAGLVEGEVFDDSPVRCVKVIIERMAASPRIGISCNTSDTFRTCSDYCLCT